MAQSPESEDRRNFLRVAVIGGIAVVSAGVGALSVFRAPQTRGDAAPGPKPLIPMDGLGGLETGVPVGVEITLSVRDAWRLRNKQQRVYVVRTAKGDDASSFKALSPICSHAGCTIEYDDDQNQFICPCHDAKFETSGAKIDGPAPDDMEALAISIGEHEDKPWLFVDWREFKTGAGGDA